MKLISHQVTRSPSHQLKKKQLIISCLLLVAFFYGCAKREIININSTGKNIICFGDSITQGYGANPGEDFPKYLGELTGLPVINVGIDGDTSVHGMARFEKDVLSQKPRLVLIEFGGNDFLKKVPREVTVKTLNEMIGRIQAAGAMVGIVDISAGMFLKDYRAMLAKIARERKAIFIPQVLNGVITNPNLKSDFLHPNRAGYIIVAKKVYKAIKPYLNNQ